jgi:hypothetical protein
MSTSSHLKSPSRFSASSRCRSTSVATTASPRASRSLTRWLPMNPPAPVIRTLRRSVVMFARSLDDNAIALLEGHQVIELREHPVDREDQRVDAVAGLDLAELLCRGGCDLGVTMIILVIVPMGRCPCSTMVVLAQHLHVHEVDRELQHLGEEVGKPHRLSWTDSVAKHQALLFRWRSGRCACARRPPLTFRPGS